MKAEKRTFWERLFASNHLALHGFLRRRVAHAWDVQDLAADDDGVRRLYRANTEDGKPVELRKTTGSTGFRVDSRSLAWCVGGVDGSCEAGYPSTPLGQGSNSDVMDTLAGELVAAIDALAVDGVVDPKRVGVMGQSFGGFSTAAVLARRSDRFRAGIAMAGIYDWMFAYGMVSIDHMLSDSGDIYNPEIKMIEHGQIQLQRPFWEAADAYRRNSPIFDIQNIRSPLLFLHGDLDMATTGLSGAMRMYNAMVRAGKTTALVHYWGQGHVAQSASAIRDQWSRITTWFDHYLKAGTQANVSSIK